MFSLLAQLTDTSTEATDAAAAAAGATILGGMLIFWIIAGLIGLLFFIWWIILVIDLSKIIGFPLVSRLTLLLYGGQEIWQSRFCSGCPQNTINDLIKSS